MKKTSLLVGLLTTTKVQAHTLPHLPEGLMHELLHMAPVVLPILCLGFLAGFYLRR